MAPQELLKTVKELRKTFDGILSFYNELSDEAFEELYARMETLIKKLEQDAQSNLADITQTPKLQVLTKTDTFITNQVPQEES